MPQNKVLLEFSTAKVEIAVLQADLFVGDRRIIRDGEGRRPGVVQQQEGIGDEFDVAGGHVGVGEACAAGADAAGDGDDVLGPRGLGLGVGQRRGFFVEHHLRDAGAVAEVEEDEVAVVAAAVHPAHQGNGFAGVRDAEIAAAMRALQGAKKVESHNPSIVICRMCACTKACHLDFDGKSAAFGRDDRACGIN
jgi:hypothetical protein